MGCNCPSGTGPASGAEPLAKSQTTIPVIATVPKVKYRISSETIDWETLGGFPNLPAMVRAEQSSAASHATRDLRSREKLRRRRATNPFQLSAT